jgi:hypothetical protein
MFVIPSVARSLSCPPIEAAERLLVVTLLGMTVKVVAVKSLTVEVGINNG